MRGEGDELRRYRRSIVGHLSECASAGSDISAVEQIVGELLSNVYRYTPGPFCAETWWDEHGGATLAIHDCGACFDPQAGADGDWSAEHGRGLAIIRALGGVIDVVRADHGGCTVAVRLPIRREASRDPKPTPCPEAHPFSRDRHCPRLARAAGTSVARTARA